MSIAELAALDRVLVVGSFLRKDHPLLAHRLRQSVKKKAQLSIVHSAADELLIDVANRMLVSPSELPRALAEVVVAAAGAAGATTPPTLAGIAPSQAARDIAASLKGGERSGIFLGNFAQQHPRAAQLHALAQVLAELTGAKLGFLTEAANSVGGWVVGALPHAGGLDAAAMLSHPRRAYIVLHAEPDLDMADPAAARAALGAAELVVALTPFASVAAEQAHAQLPVAAFAETAGTFVNCEGRVQSFNGAALPPGEARPAWKVLRVLGSLLDLPGFDFESISTVRAELPDAAAVTARLSNATRTAIAAPLGPGGGLERVADVPIYAADALVRRAPALQKTADAKPPAARMNAATRSGLRLTEGAAVRVRNGAGEAILKVAVDEGVPDGCVRIAAAHPATRMLGPMFGTLAMEQL
jgi:NADH-quinone oxidoreductase subunit G